MASFTSSHDLTPSPDTIGGTADVTPTVIPPHHRTPTPLLPSSSPPARLTAGGPASSVFHPSRALMGAVRR